MEPAKSKTGFNERHFAIEVTLSTTLCQKMNGLLILGPILNNKVVTKCLCAFCELPHYNVGVVVKRR